VNFSRKKCKGEEEKVGGTEKKRQAYKCSGKGHWSVRGKCRSAKKRRAENKKLGSRAEGKKPPQENKTITIQAPVVRNCPQPTKVAIRRKKEGGGKKRESGA